LPKKCDKTVIPAAVTVAWLELRELLDRVTIDPQSKKPKFKAEVAVGGWHTFQK
jgi:hypothetical protein